MLPHHHAGASLTISVVYVSGRVLLFHKGQSVLQAIVIIIAATALGVLVDADHALWSLVLNPRLTLKYLRTLNLRGLYWDLTNPSGRSYQKIVAYNRKYPRLFSGLHGVWLCLVSYVLYLTLPMVALLRDYVWLFWSVLVLHFVSDILWWR